MKAFAIIIACLFTAHAHGQELKPEFDGHKWEAPYMLSIPKNWTIERFLIPISFAPQITYTGVEDVRFAPGWGKVTSSDYWSYAFLWYLDDRIKIDRRIIESNLHDYYTGLISINGSNIPNEKLIPVVTSFKEVKKNKGDIKKFVGTIKMLDYMEQKPIILNCKAHLKFCSGLNKTFVFYQLSPQPFTNKIWLSLDKLWKDFQCKKN